MGREIRRVPPHWEHPRYTKASAPSSERIGEYRSCNDEDYDTASQRWLEELDQWRAGVHEDQKYSKTKYYWDYAGAPPDEDTCRPAFTEPPTWVQVYQTISEGTPVTPPFATEQELIDYLVAHGDFWDQERGDGGWERKNAETFVKRGSAPSMIVVRSAEGTTIQTPRDME